MRRDIIDVANTSTIDKVNVLQMFGIYTFFGLYCVRGQIKCAF